MCVGMQLAVSVCGRPGDLMEVIHFLNLVHQPSDSACADIFCFIFFFFFFFFFFFIIFLFFFFSSFYVPHVAIAWHSSLTLPFPKILKICPAIYHHYVAQMEGFSFVKRLFRSRRILGLVVSADAPHIVHHRPCRFDPVHCSISAG